MKSTIIYFLVLNMFLFSCSSNINKGAYVCEPCNLPCDTILFNNKGICPHCEMELIHKSELVGETKLILNEINIETGSGVFLIEGGETKKEKSIKVYYHKPRNYNNNSKMLIVIPGAGRNADSYRDAWIENSEKYGVLILSPFYSEALYPFEEYHLGGVIKNSNLQEIIEYVDNSNEVILNEENFTYEFTSGQNEWIFNDFDRVFNLVVKNMNSSQSKYDIFGHSAGGQILHRFAILKAHSKANRIVASNSGFYTLPNRKFDFPFGIKNIPQQEKDLSKAFEKKLILLIGELDNENEKGGTLLRSKSANLQGKHRLDRAKYFFEESKIVANENNSTFNWQLKIISNIGHEHRKMGIEAAKLLYDI